MLVVARLRVSKYKIQNNNNNHHKHGTPRSKWISCVSNLLYLQSLVIINGEKRPTKKLRRFFCCCCCIRSVFITPNSCCSVQIARPTTPKTMMRNVESLLTSHESLECVDRASLTPRKLNIKCVFQHRLATSPLSPPPPPLSSSSSSKPIPPPFPLSLVRPAERNPPRFPK